MRNLKDGAAQPFILQRITSAPVELTCLRALDTTSSWTQIFWPPVMTVVTIFWCTALNTFPYAISLQLSLSLFFLLSIISQSVIPKVLVSSRRSLGNSLSPSQPFTHTMHNPTHYLILSLSTEGFVFIIQVHTDKI